MLADEYILSFILLSAHIQPTEFYQLLCYLHHQFFNRQRLRAGHYKIPAQQQALAVVGNVMRPHIIILAFIFLTSLKVTAQTYDATQPTDTICLRQLSFKKVLAYQVGNATILADYNDFMKSYKPFWNKFKKGVRSLDRGKVKDIEENPWYVKRFKFLDSTYNRLTEQIKTRDTVFINDISFIMADIGTSYDFVGKIENRQCIVLNKSNERQSFILRQKYSYQRGPLDGWGGRLYFIPGQEKPFIRGTDWVS